MISIIAFVTGLFMLHHERPETRQRDHLDDIPQECVDRVDALDFVEPPAS